MSTTKEKWIEISFDPNKGYPAGSKLYYKCNLCQVVVPSLPDDSIMCDCGNITIDVDAGRVSIKTEQQMSLLRRAD